ncbi:MAG: hypothetical protein LBQ59_00975 [Candidatus Peribacteria bacterium]|nr:hypothetical protein [Candidatus Peribacteria bacterium]
MLDFLPSKQKSKTLSPPEYCFSISQVFSRVLLSRSSASCSFLFNSSINQVLVSSSFSCKFNLLIFSFASLIFSSASLFSEERVKIHF